MLLSSALFPMTDLNNLVGEIRDKGFRSLMSLMACLRRSCPLNHWYHSAKWVLKLENFSPKNIPVAKKLKWRGSPDPSGAGWVEAGNAGFSEAVKAGAIDLVATKYGDTGKEVQSKLVEDVLEAYPDLDYIAGTAVTAEAAVSILRARGLEGKVKILSYYFTPGVDRGIRRKQILAAPTDSPVIQGRIAIDQAIRILEKKPYQKHVGPALYVVSQENVSSFDDSSTLAPEGFKPTFEVK